MDIDDFNSIFETAIEKISNENKEFYLLGDFNLDLLKIDDDTKIEDFYNIISSNLLAPHITIPTRVTLTSKTLIDNIFSNNFDFSSLKSGNITVSISDHMPQFLIVPKSLNRICHKRKSINVTPRILIKIIREYLYYHYQMVEVIYILD